MRALKKCAAVPAESVSVSISAVRIIHVAQWCIVGEIGWILSFTSSPSTHEPIRLIIFISRKELSRTLATLNCYKKGDHVSI